MTSKNIFVQGFCSSGLILALTLALPSLPNPASGIDIEGSANDIWYSASQDR